MLRLEEEEDGNALKIKGIEEIYSQSFHKILNNPIKCLLLLEVGPNHVD